MTGPTFGSKTTVEVDSDGVFTLKTHPMFERELKQLIGEIADRARRIVGMHHFRTGKLRSSIQPYNKRAPKIIKTGPHTITGSVTAGSRRAPYARYVHEGTRPHVIKARPGGVLAFSWPDRPPRFIRRHNRDRSKLKIGNDWYSLRVPDGPGTLTQRKNKMLNTIAASRGTDRAGLAEQSRATRLTREDQVFGGDTAFAKQVKHPGTPPRPFLRRAASEVMASRRGRVHNTPGR